MINRIVSVLIVCLLALFGCGEGAVDDVIPGQISESGLVSTTVGNLAYQGVDSIKVMSLDGALVGKCKPDSSGRIRMQLAVADLNRIETMKNVFMSDTNAMILSCKIQAVDTAGNSIGSVVCSNFMSDTVEYSGKTIARFIYSDRPVTINGISSKLKKTNGISYRTTCVFALNLNKGWNCFVRRIDSYVRTDSGLYENDTYTTSLTNDLRWVYISGTKFNLVFWPQ